MTKYAYRVESRMIKEPDFPYAGQILSRPDTIADFLSPLIERDQENMVIVYLNTKNTLIGLSIQTGTLNRSAIWIREIIKGALLCAASSIVIAHNHPSGDSEPSQEDIALTKAIQAACQVVGVGFLDHVVLGDGNYCSLAARGYVNQHGGLNV